MARGTAEPATTLMRVEGDSRPELHRERRERERLVALAR